MSIPLQRRFGGSERIYLPRRSTFLRGTVARGLGPVATSRGGRRVSHSLPDGKVLASGGSEGLVWGSNKSIEPKVSWLRHRQRVHTKTFTADRARLASSGDSGDCRLKQGQGNLLDRWPNFVGDLFDSFVHPSRPRILVFTPGTGSLSERHRRKCGVLVHGDGSARDPLPRQEQEAPQRFNHSEGLRLQRRPAPFTCSQATTDLLDLQAGKRLWRQGPGRCWSHLLHA